MVVSTDEHLSRQEYSYMAIHTQANPTLPLTKNEWKTTRVVAFTALAEAAERRGDTDAHAWVQRLQRGDQA